MLPADDTMDGADDSLDDAQQRSFGAKPNPQICIASSHKPNPQLSIVSMSPEEYTTKAFMEGAWTVFGGYPRWVYWEMEDASFLRLKPRQIKEKLEEALRKEGYVCTDGYIMAYVDKDTYHQVSGRYKKKCREINLFINAAPKEDSRFEFMFLELLTHTMFYRRNRYDDHRTNMLVLSKNISGEEGCKYSDILRASQSGNFNVGVAEPVWFLGKLSIETMLPADDTMDGADDSMDDAEETMEERPASPGEKEYDGFFRYEEGKIGVFWNLEDYPVPDIYINDPFKIYESIKNTLVSKQWVGELSVHAYVEEDYKFPMELRDQYDRARIKISVLPQGNRAKYRLMAFDVLSWAVMNPVPSNMFLLSKEVNLLTHFEDLYFAAYGGVVSEKRGGLQMPEGWGDWLLSGLSNKRRRGDNSSGHSDSEDAGSREKYPK